MVFNKARDIFQPNDQMNSAVELTETQYFKTLSLFWKIKFYAMITSF